MIKLENKINVDAADADFPFGSVRDKTLSAAGTKYDKNTTSDIFQFFEKMFSESGIISNGLLDNELNGWQLYEAFRKLTRPYKVYTIAITQILTSNPVVSTQFQNEIGTIVWTRISTGVFEGVLTGAFLNNKTTCFIQSSSFGIDNQIFRIDDDTIRIITFESDTNTLIDGELNFSNLEIRVYD